MAETLVFTLAFKSLWFTELGFVININTLVIPKLCKPVMA
ncbi:hypothetical protein COO91_07744 [Nostoc flagelliforme CCNUN1]|uniref:Uncharacterized protein n=1 Tax=Nostoc flagelliforme CCNUN1 TaxID=2038116 RepID=A0A2K8T235_9NOSO|nr:hypothetical protein COO91_07744 [Nostoc flagelliforme CCNUN1]